MLLQDLVLRQGSANLFTASQHRLEPLGRGVPIEVVVGKTSGDSVPYFPPFGGSFNAEGYDLAREVGARDQAVVGAWRNSLDEQGCMGRGRRAYLAAPYVPRAMAMSRYCRDTAWTLTITSLALGGASWTSRMDRVW